MSKKSKHIFWGMIEEADYRHNCGLTVNNFPQEFFPVVTLFAEDCNYNLKEIYIQDSVLYILGSNYNNTKQNELMLRFGHRQLTVARIKFINRRQGNMCRLYKELIKIQKKYKLNKIILESCQTDAMQSWAEKNGFILTDAGTEFGFSSTYIES